MATYKYEVALSFAGEDRAFAEAVAKGLKSAGIKVFYDNFYTADLWGKDLSVELGKIYHESSQFCIMILSQYYVDKMWTSFERQQAIERLVREKGNEYVLPVRLDGFKGKVPGLSGVIGYLPAKRCEPVKVIETFLEKIGRNHHETHRPDNVENILIKIHAEIVLREVELRRTYDKDRDHVTANDASKGWRLSTGAHLGRTQDSYLNFLDRLTEMVWNICIKYVKNNVLDVDNFGSLFLNEMDNLLSKYKAGFLHICDNVPAGSKHASATEFENYKVRILEIYRAKIDEFQMK